jgi:hypothetical protein
VVLIRTDVSDDRIASYRIVSRVAVLYKSLLFRSVPVRLVTLKMEAIRSSETSVLIRATRRHLPEDDNHQMNPVYTLIP